MKRKSIIITFRVGAIKRLLRKYGKDKVRDDALNLMDCAILTLLDTECESKKKVLEVNDRDLFL